MKSTAKSRASRDEIPEHPAARIIPSISEQDLAALARDIKERGQLEACAVLDGQLLDGRSRVAACKRLGILAKFVEVSGIDDPVAFVLSKNLHRRHLTDRERTIIAAQVSKLHTAAAAARKKQGTSAPNGAKATEVAARQLGVGPRSVDRALKVEREGCQEVQSALGAGKITVATAERLVKEFPQVDEQAKIISEAVKSAGAGDVNRVVNEIVKSRKRGAASSPQSSSDDRVICVDNQTASTSQNDAPGELDLCSSFVRLDKAMKDVYVRWPRNRRQDLASKLRSWSTEIIETDKIANFEDPEVQDGAARSADVT